MARKKAAPRRSKARTSARAGSSRRTKRAPARVGKLVCPDCGFKAKHAMGLGRHRSARHGVVSKRQQMRKRSAAAGRDGRANAQTVRAVRDLERRFDKLLNGLERLVEGARRSAQ